jgi:hypothetical protein
VRPKEHSIGAKKFMRHLAYEDAALARVSLLKRRLPWIMLKLGLGPGGWSIFMRRKLYIVSALVAIWCSTAYAKITIRQAEYTGSMLLVRGETARPGQTVTLAGRYKTRTDRNRRFQFRVPICHPIALPMLEPVRSCT